MAQTQPSAAREQVRDIVPGLIDLSERVLFGEVWERPGLSKRDRSLITCATLIALGRERQLTGHLQRALDNGLSKNELSEVITHLAFYAGWPNAMSALPVDAPRPPYFVSLPRPALRSSGFIAGMISMPASSAVKKGSAIEGICVESFRSKKKSPVLLPPSAMK